MRLAADRVIVVTATVLMAACSHSGRSGAGSPLPSATCSAPASAPRNDITENVTVATADQAALVRSLEQRLRLMGAVCPEATVGPAVAVDGLPPPSFPGAGTLDVRWLRGVGDDPIQAEGSYLLRSGDLSLRTVTREPPGECTGNPGLRDHSPADVVVAGHCTHVSKAFIDHLHPTKAVVTPTADPSTWTLTLTLDRPTTRRVAKAAKPLFASIDGFPLGRAALAGGVLAVTGHYYGGGTEARADAINVQAQIPLIGAWSEIS